MSLVRTLAVRWTLAAARGLPAGAQLVAETTNVSVALCRSSSVQWPVCSRVAVSRVQHPSLRLGAHVPPDIGVVGFEWTAVGYCRIICIKIGAVLIWFGHWTGPVGSKMAPVWNQLPFRCLLVVCFHLTSSGRCSFAYSKGRPMHPVETEGETGVAVRSCCLASGGVPSAFERSRPTGGRWCGQLLCVDFNWFKGENVFVVFHWDVIGGISGSDDGTLADYRPPAHWNVALDDENVNISSDGRLIGFHSSPTGGTRSGGIGASLGSIYLWLSTRQLDSFA